MAAKRILVIDDDMDICHLLRRFLTKNGYEVNTAHSGTSGLTMLDAEILPDLVMADFRLGDMDGMELISKIKARLPYIKILIITGYSDIRTAVNLMKMGAYDYIAKPIIPQEILLTIQRILESPAPLLKAAEPDINDAPNSKILPSKGRISTTLDYIQGMSSTALNLRRQIELVAPTPYSLIIYGESGSGKEAVARLIHAQSGRKNMPFVAMDCGAIPKELANSELFGHEKGAFTGAITTKEGHFEMANGGTIFLDEVANLPYDVQVALLRVVQERKCRRVGGNKEINLDVRIIVASNERLIEAARKGKFREDLYYRFNEFSIEVPPLRERKEDIMLFANRFLKETNKELDKELKGFEEEVIHIFKNYAWHGNIRELRNVIKRAALLSDGNLVQAQALPTELLHAAARVSEDNITEDLIDTAKPLNMPHEAAHAIATPSVFDPKISINLKETAQRVEYEAILNTLQEVRYNKSKAAEILGIDRKTLYNKLKKLGIE